jgi:hypothetical protein
MIATLGYKPKFLEKKKNMGSKHREQQCTVMGKNGPNSPEFEKNKSFQIARLLYNTFQ